MSQTAAAPAEKVDYRHRVSLAMSYRVIIERFLIAKYPVNYRKHLNNRAGFRAFRTGDRRAAKSKGIEDNFGRWSPMQA
ncbi:hypothetical protein D3C73_1475670 [compost metagenome]